MADLSRLDLPVPAASVLVIGTGGTGRTRAVYADGVRTDAVRTDAAGNALHTLSGVAVSVNGVGMDGATVETTTPIETVTAGTIFRAEGIVTVGVRAGAKPGFKSGDAPRGVLDLSVFVERLTPIASAHDLAAAAAAEPKRATAAKPA